MKSLDSLEKAYKKEKDGVPKVRMLAVLYVLADGIPVAEAAHRVRYSENPVYDWVDWFREGGVDALRDCPRSGRPTKIPHKTMDSIIKEYMKENKRANTKKLRKFIIDRTGVELSVHTVRRIMKKHNLSPKRATIFPTNHASARQVRRWQRYVDVLFPNLKEEDFVITAMDEAFFHQDPKTGRKYWSPIGSKDMVPSTGNRGYTTAFGAVTDDNRQVFRQSERFNSKTFMSYCMELHWRLGKVALICDRATPHRSKMTKKFIAENKDWLRIIPLPKGSPYLNPVEACWKFGKYDLLVSEHYKTLTDLRNTVSLYYRTKRFNLDFYSYIHRSPYKVLKNICS